MYKKLQIRIVLAGSIFLIGAFFLFFHLNLSSKSSIGSDEVERKELVSAVDASSRLLRENENVGSVAIEKSVAISASCTYPSQILNLTNWKETLPVGSPKKPTEIKQPSLASYSLSPYFLPNSACDGVIFRAPVSGITTSGSGYPRSELREMSNSGKSLASWPTNSGVHSMLIEQAITAVPKTKKHIVAGQIHDADDDVVVIRLEYPKLFIDINGANGPILDPNYRLGRKFTVKFVAEGGKIKIYYNGSKTPAYVMNRVGSGNYFKAGAYAQSNCSKEKICDGNNFGEVVIYKLQIGHQNP